MSEPSKKAGKPLSQDREFQSKGAVEQDRRGQSDNMSSFTEQIGHRDQRPLSKDQDTDFPEPGNSPEYSMQRQDQSKKESSQNESARPSPGNVADDSKLHPKNDPDGNAADEIDNRDPDPGPGERQKENQNEKKDDDLAA